MPAVDENKYIDEVLAFTEIVFDHLFPFFPLVYRYLGEAITRQIDDIPGVVDIEMVDQLCLPGSAGGLCQFVVFAKHIDHRRLADVTASDKGVLRPVGFRTLRIVGTADHINGGMDVHCFYK